MREDRRLWIYSGLAVPDGVAVVRAPVYRTMTRRGILLIGQDGQIIRALLQAMTRLPLQRAGGMRVDLRPGWDLISWLESEAMEEHLEEQPADLVLAALSPEDPEGRAELEGRAAEHGAETVWLPPAGVFAQGCIAAPVRASASEVASWASRVFDVVG